MFFMVLSLVVACSMDGVPHVAQETPCEAAARACTEYVARGQARCEHHHREHYRAYCRNNYAGDRRPLDRYGRPWETSNSMCLWYIQNASRLFEDALDVDERKEILQRLQQCRVQVRDECVAHHAESEPGDSTGQVGPHELRVADFFGLLTADADPIPWGGDRGYRETCELAAASAATACTDAIRGCTD